MGRWVNRDPIGELGGLNIYVFCENRPMGRVDIDGQSWWDVIGNVIEPIVVALINQGYLHLTDPLVQQTSGPQTCPSGATRRRIHFEEYKEKWQIKGVIVPVVMELTITKWVKHTITEVYKCCCQWSTAELVEYDDRSTPWSRERGGVVRIFTRTESSLLTKGVDCE